MSAPHIIKGHAAMSAQELGLSPSIVTKYCEAPTNRQRLRAYRDRLEHWLEHAPAQGEVVKQPEQLPLIEPTVTVEAEALQIAHNISKFLRKGGAK